MDLSFGQTGTKPCFTKKTDLLKSGGLKPADFFDWDSEGTVPPDFSVKGGTAMRDRPRGNKDGRRNADPSRNVRTVERDQRLQLMQVSRRKGARRR